MAEKSNAKEGKKPAKAKDQKPAPKPKSGAAVAPASRAKAPAAPPVAGESESGSESSEDVRKFCPIILVKPPVIHVIAVRNLRKRKSRQRTRASQRLRLQPRSQGLRRSLLLQ